MEFLKVLFKKLFKKEQTKLEDFDVIVERIGDHGFKILSDKELEPKQIYDILKEMGEI